MRYAVIRQLLHEYAEGIMLDIGCAEGWFSFWTPNSVKYYIGIDISIPKIKRAKQEVRIPKAEFIVASFDSFPFRRKIFDTIVWSEGPEHATGPEHIFREIEFLLKDNGVLIVSTMGLHPPSWYKVTSKYALVGVYFLTPVIFDMIGRLKPSWRGEHEITDALQMLIDGGYRVGYRFVSGWWLDTGKKDDILYANALILDERIERRIEGEITNSKVEGRVAIERGAKVVNSVVRGPAIIGEDCYIENSFIGPYTSVGRNSKIINSNVEYSVIMEEAQIVGIDRLEESLIGRNAKVMKNGKRNIVRLHIGDYSEVEV
ncbi:MAG: methyltransferase domain-containing protein [Metallosphaera sp.]